MRDAPDDDQPAVITLANGDIHCDTDISFRSVSVRNGEVYVHSAEGGRIELRVPGAAALTACTSKGNDQEHAFIVPMEELADRFCAVESGPRKR